MTFLLALSTAGLAAANWQLAALEVDISPLSIPGQAEHPGKPGSELATVEPSSTETLEAYPQTTARPLFSSSRRPPAKAEPEPAPEAPPPTPDGLRLIGLMHDGPGSGQALVRAGEAQGRWISEGDTINGWTVQRIGNAGITLRTGRHEYELNLYPKDRAAKPDD